MFYVKHVKCKKSGYTFICMYVASEYLMLHDHLKRNYINSYIVDTIKSLVYFYWPIQEIFFTNFLYLCLESIYSFS